MKISSSDGPSKHNKQFDLDSLGILVSYKLFIQQEQTIWENIIIWVQGKLIFSPFWMLIYKVMLDFINVNVGANKTSFYLS